MPFDYSDSFTGANGTLLQAHAPDSRVPFAWTKLGANDITLLNNRLAMVAGGAAGRYRANVNTLNPSTGGYEAILYIIVAGGNSSVAAALSLVKPGTADGYRFVLSKDLSGLLGFSLGRMTGGGVVSLADSGLVANPPDGIHELKLVRLGNGVFAYWRGVLLLQAVDATHIGTSEITVDGNSNATNSYVVGAVAAGKFDPIEPFIDPAEVVLDCIDDRIPVVTYVETFTAPDGTLLENYVEPSGFNWAGGLFTPGGIWVITAGKLRISLFNGSNQLPKVYPAIAFTVGQEIFCDLTTQVAMDVMGFVFCNPPAGRAGYGLRVWPAGGVGTAARVIAAVWDVLGTESASSFVDIDWPDGTAKRLGITILNNAPPQFQVWTEPAGGGARTIIIPLWAPVTNHLGDSAGHGGLMIFAYFVQVGQSFDNLSVLSQVGSDVAHPAFDETAGNPASPVYTVVGDP